MKLRAVFFDLDGTLLPMDQDAFIEAYMKSLGAMAPAWGIPDSKSLVDAIWASTGLMLGNDGEMTNEERFWACYCRLLGRQEEREKALFDAYYAGEFQTLRSLTGVNPLARETLDLVHSLDLIPVLATNPVFPPAATNRRIAWAGLEPEDFVLRTTYDDCGYCKPNPAYYRDLLERLNLEPESCLMVGNDATEDMVAQTLGMEVFLLTDCLINRENLDIDRWPHGDFRALLAHIRRLACQ